MGNSQARSTSPFRQSLLKHAIKRTVFFESQPQLADYLSQLNRRMTLRSTYIPRLIYYQTIQLFGDDSNSQPPKFQVELYFQQIQQTGSSQSPTMSVSSCKCEELITTIRELRFRYGNFALTNKNVFFTALNHFPTSLWISPQIEACLPAIKVSEREMCESIVRTFRNISEKKQCLHRDKWRNIYVRRFQDLSKAIKTPIKSVVYHRIPTEASQESPRQLPWKTSGRSKTSPSSEVSQQQPKTKTLSIVNQQYPQASNFVTFNQINIPHLNRISAINNCSQSSAKNTDRLRTDIQPQIKVVDDYMIKQDSGFLTTARTPRNYIMRKSSELTIFPNQYQQKFQKVHKENCKGQPSARFLTFKNAMQILKTKSEKELPLRIPQKSFTKYDPTVRIRQQPSISSFSSCPVEAQ